MVPQTWLLSVASKRFRVKGFRLWTRSATTDRSAMLTSSGQPWQLVGALCCTVVALCHARL